MSLDLWNNLLLDPDVRLDTAIAEIERLRANTEHYKYQAAEAGLMRVRYGQQIERLRAELDALRHPMM